MFIKLAHRYWKELLSPGDFAIDATAGNGFDTLFLASLPLAGLFVIDLQPQAIASTKHRLEAYHIPLEKIFFFQMSHATFPETACKQPIKLIVYNLGYLPGSDKMVKTLASSTLQSLQNAFDLVVPDGMISIMCYPGHPEGAEEEASILDWAKGLPPSRAAIYYHTQPNKPKSPTLMILRKLI